MNSEDRLYRDLQIHLDKETIGFPETPSGSDLAVLKQLFTPAQAEIAMLLTYKLQSLEQVQASAKEIGKSAEETERLLDATAARGVIGFRKKNGVKHYRAIPFLVGMRNCPTPCAFPDRRGIATPSSRWIRSLKS